MVCSAACHPGTLTHRSSWDAFGVLSWAWPWSTWWISSTARIWNAVNYVVFGMCQYSLFFPILLPGYPTWPSDRLLQFKFITGLRKPMSGIRACSRAKQAQLQGNALYTHWTVAVTGLKSWSADPFKQSGTEANQVVGFAARPDSWQLPSFVPLVLCFLNITSYIAFFPQHSLCFYKVSHYELHSIHLMKAT